MKTLKFALVAAIVACTMISLSNANTLTGQPGGLALKSVTLSIEKALSIPGLPLAMYEQIDPQELLNSPQAILVAKVTFKGVEYRIRATREQWVKFFKHKGDVTVNPAPGFGIG
jgi:hypothetical protein